MQLSKDSGLKADLGDFAFIQNADPLIGGRSACVSRHLCYRKLGRLVKHLAEDFLWRDII